MSDTDDLATASQLLDYAGQFAFIFPGAGQIIGGGLSFVGALLGYAADTPDDVPSNTELKKDIQELASLVKKKFKDQDTQAIETALSAAREDESTEKLLLDKIRTKPAKYLLHNGPTVPDVYTQATDLNHILINTDGPPFRQACSTIEGLVDMGEKVSFLLIYCNARTRLHSQIQKKLFMYQAVWVYNNQQGDDSYPTESVPEKWYDADILVSALTTSLEDAVKFVEPILVQLKQDYATRVSRAKTEGMKGENPAQDIKLAYERITRECHLDKISLPAVESLFGTDKLMGVVDFWKQALDQNCKKPYQGKSFTRGDKLDPPRKMPTFWLNTLDTKQISAIAKNGGSGTKAIVEEKIKSTLSAMDRPFLGPFRNVDDSTKLLTLVVVNKTKDPLLLAEPIAQVHGGLVTKPVVAEYTTAASNEQRGTANFKPKHNDESIDPESWIDPAPIGKMGPGSSSVGVWQLVTVPSDGAAGGVVKFKKIPSAGWAQCYAGGEFPKDSSVGNSGSVGISDHGSAANYYQQYIAGQARMTDFSSSCNSSCWPKDCTGADNKDIVVTIVIG